MSDNINNPLHGKTLEVILNELITFYGFKTLALYVDINCFKTNPSLKSSLTFLRRTPWARTKIETLYVNFANSDDYLKYQENLKKLLK
jgi:uncharacterized protein (DUF2132 family)